MFYKRVHFQKIYKHKSFLRKKYNADLFVCNATFYIINVIHFIETLIINLIFAGQLTTVFISFICFLGYLCYKYNIRSYTFSWVKYKKK